MRTEKVGDRDKHLSSQPGCNVNPERDHCTGLGPCKQVRNVKVVVVGWPPRQIVTD